MICELALHQFVDLGIYRRLSTCRMTAPINEARHTEHTKRGEVSLRLSAADMHTNRREVSSRAINGQKRTAHALGIQASKTSCDPFAPLTLRRSQPLQHRQVTERRSLLLDSSVGHQLAHRNPHVRKSRCVLNLDDRALQRDHLTPPTIEDNPIPQPNFVHRATTRDVSEIDEPSSARTSRRCQIRAYAPARARSLLCKRSVR